MIHLLLTATTVLVVLAVCLLGAVLILAGCLWIAETITAPRAVEPAPESVDDLLADLDWRWRA